MSRSNEVEAEDIPKESSFRASKAKCATSPLCSSHSRLLGRRYQDTLLGYVIIFYPQRVVETDLNTNTSNTKGVLRSQRPEREGER